MKTLDLNKLNNGLTRIVSVRTRPPRRRVTVLPRRVTGRVFQLGALHHRDMTAQTLRRNRRGYVASTVNTVAHSPSLYHWLYHRCGIAFAETREHVRAGALRVNGRRITSLDECEVQLPWSAFQQMDVQVRTTLTRVREAHRRTLHTNKNNNDNNHNSNDDDTNEVWVPALQRALHREYFLLHTHPGVSLWSDEAEPRSFVHALTPHLGGGATAALGLNVLRPIGFCNGMYGLALASNDVAAVRYWNNNCLGNYGVFDVRFARGVPSHVVREVARDVTSTLAKTVAPTLPRGLLHPPPCYCKIERVPTVLAAAAATTTTKTMTTAAADGGGGVTSKHDAYPADVVAQQFAGVALHDERLLVAAPQMPFRLTTRIRRATGRITLVRSGPFVLPATLQTQRLRALTPSELAVFYTFERRLKVNRMLLSLHEFVADDDDDDEGDDMDATMASYRSRHNDNDDDGDGDDEGDGVSMAAL